MREYIECILEERDKLYKSKFLGAEVAVAAALASSEKAVAAAFLSQQTAMQTALVSAEKAVAAALAAADRAGIKAENSSEKRLEGLNELRNIVTDQQAAFMQRLEAMAFFKSNDDKLASLQYNQDVKLEAVRSSIDKSFENVISGQASLHEQLAQSVSRSELMITKDQVAQTSKSITECTALFVSRAEFEAVKVQLAQNLESNTERWATFVTRHEFDAIQKIVYIGIGGLAAIEFLFKFIVK
jgi:hypothetical protein